MKNCCLASLLLILFQCNLQRLVAQIDPSDVTIVRDSYGIPHIYGSTDAATAYGLAWAHAEDNFHDIQLALLAGKGMMGRVEGIDGALFDYALEFTNIDSIVEARFESDLSPEFRKVLAGYVQGVNDFAIAHPKEVILKKSLPFQSQDVIKGYVLSTTLMAGLGMALKTTREDRFDEILNINDIGSNAFAVSPFKMSDGKGYLLNNSHQPIEGRFAWWEAHVSSEEGWNMIGALFPGGISIFVGTNPTLGWTHTNNYHNFGDVYELEINPKNKNQYKYGREWKNFHTRKITLKVKLLGIPLPIKRKLYFCEYGPVFKTKHGMYAFRFPGYMDIRSAEQWFRMNKAKNMLEFEEALSMQSIPLFNVIYADVEGNILYHSGGRIAKRDPKLDWTYPLPGQSPLHQWHDIVPYEEMPMIKNPDCGFVYNANNTPLNASGEACDWDGDFPGLQTFEYNRGDVFRKLLRGYQGQFTEAFLEEVKFNTSYAEDGEYMRRNKILFELDEATYPDIADAIQKMKTWDMKGDVFNPHAALAMITHDFLRQKVNAPFAILMIREENLAEEDAVWALRKAKDLMLKSYGTMDVPLGEVQRYIRGDISYPADGLREVPRATDTKLTDKQRGLYKVKGGDSYIQIIRYSKKGVEIKSVNVYGASGHEDSPHYNDQLGMFANHEFKEMTFDKKTILENAERVYSPGQE